MHVPVTLFFFPANPQFLPKAQERVLSAPSASGGETAVKA
jgi:hypothetical protein